MATACLAGVLLALAWLPAAAQQVDNNEAPEAARYFQFEVLVFRNLDKAAQHEEKWPTQRDLKRPDNAVDLDQMVAQAEADQADTTAGSTAAGTTPPASSDSGMPPADAGPASAQPIAANSGAPPATQTAGPSNAAADGNPAAAPTQPLPDIAAVPANERMLDTIRRRLQRSGRFDVLYYQAWRQTLTGDDPGIPYHITGGIHYGNDYELDGYLTFSLRRYLHLDADLWLTDFATGTDTDSGGWSLGAEENNDNGWQLGNTSDNGRFRSQYYDMLSEHHLIVQTAHLDEHRRMRSSQLNYLDHPLFGVLVLITPVQPPAAASTPVTPGAPGASPAATPTPAQPPASAPSE